MVNIRLLLTPQRMLGLSVIRSEEIEKVIFFLLSVFVLWSSFLLWLTAVENNDFLSFFSV